MRHRSGWTVSVMLAVCICRPAAAQRAQAILPSAAVSAPSSPGPNLLALHSASGTAARPAIASSSGAALALRAAIGVVGGAVVGGWLGYFTSQVSRSDWDALPTDQKATVRRGYIVTGAGLGAVAGYFMRPRVPPRLEGLPQPEGVPLRTGRLLITASELHRSVATTALEAVEMERPDWIASLRYDERNGHAPAASATPELGSVAIYVGDVQVGKLETLRDMSIPEVAELRYYSARDARKRWGVEHKYGAIEVVPVSAATAVPSPGS